MKNILKLLLLNLFLLNSISANDFKLIDPKISVFTGKSSYNLNIDTPRSLNSISPNLSINYESQSQNGILGVDTSLDGISKITRCSQNLIFSDYDSFCFNDEAMVKVKNKTNEYLLFKNPSIKFTKYGSSSNKDEKNDTGNQYWVMNKANGERLTFGKNINSKINIPYTYKYYYPNGTNYENKTYEGTIEWAIEKKEDLNSNHSLYSYNKIKNVLYINSIKYEHNKITFEYENRSDNYEIKNTYAKGLVEIHKDENESKFKINYPSSYPIVSKRLKSILLYENNKLSNR